MVLLASLYTPALGLERDRAKVAVARAQALSLGLDQAFFWAGDYLTADLNPHRLLFIHPDRPIDSLVVRLNQVYQGRLLVYGPHSTGTGPEPKAEYNLALGQARLFEL